MGMPLVMLGNIVLRDRKVLSERRDLYRGAHGESQREEDYFQSARAHPWFCLMSRRVGIFFVKVAELVNQSVEDYLAQDSFDWVS